MYLYRSVLLYFSGKQKKYFVTRQTENIPHRALPFLLSVINVISQYVQTVLKTKCMTMNNLQLCGLFY